MNRASRRAAVFEDSRHRTLFVHFLSQIPERFGVRLHAWVVMPNHYHLMLEDPDGELSSAMQWFGARFVQSVNALHAMWDGPLFRARFHSRWVVSDAHWRHLGPYIHLNPLRAGLVAKADDAWCGSDAVWRGRERAPSWLSLDARDVLLGGARGYTAYVNELLVESDEPDGFIEACVRSSVSPGVRMEVRRELEAALASHERKAGRPLPVEVARMVRGAHREGARVADIAAVVGVSARTVRRVVQRGVQSSA